MGNIPFHSLTDTLLVIIMGLIYRIQAQQGFITLDCGLSAGSSYVDELGIEYVSDAAFIDSGEVRNISSASNNSYNKRWLQTLRSFPEGTRNCYNIKLESGSRYLVRATFHHGYYDGTSGVTFDLHIGYRKWATVQAFGRSTVFEEIILATTTNYLSICLVKQGSEMPFISLLELRPMTVGAYNLTGSISLGTVVRYNFGSATGKVVRFPDDAYDRLWEPTADAAWTNIGTTKAIDSQDFFPFQAPSEVMRTASLPTTGDKLDLIYIPDNYRIPFESFLYFAELENLTANNQSRYFIISSNSSAGQSTPMSLTYLKTSIVTYPEAADGNQYSMSLTKAASSTLPPIINALEVYTPIDMSQAHSDRGEVDAMMNIKLVYGIQRNWQGDPCVPQEYAWDGVGCNINTSDGVPRITALNLSFSRLVGAIASDIFNLTQLQILDLSNNDLNGPVPEFLAEMPTLNFLNVAYNNLNGLIPPALIEKSERKLLHLSFEGNLNVSASTSYNNNNNSNKRRRLFVFLVLVTVAVIITTAAMILFRFTTIRRRATRKKPAWEASTKPAKSLVSRKWKKGHFTYARLLAITNNFKEVLGQGGSGTVYHGYLHGNPVAVKIFSSSSTQSYRQFQAEVEILLRVHHGNLLSLIGYCDECNNVGLIYEYMANGNLQEYMSGDGRATLSWEERLKISLGAAQGLEYLHHGCEPQIVHRDVKTSNILLSESLQAKLADFGLSRSFPVTGGSYISTVVAGTIGYFDPEYFKSSRFTTKSDVYSFGVVLLEIITGKSAVSEAEGMHLSQLVTSVLARGQVTDAVDPKLGVEFDIDSITKAVELAMTCVSENSSQRPTMHQVVNELSDCLAIELARG